MCCSSLRLCVGLVDDCHQDNASPFSPLATLPLLWWRALNDIFQIPEPPRSLRHLPRKRARTPHDRIYICSTVPFYIPRSRAGRRLRSLRSPLRPQPPARGSTVLRVQHPPSSRRTLYGMRCVAKVSLYCRRSTSRAGLTACDCASTRVRSCKDRESRRVAHRRARPAGACGSSNYTHEPHFTHCNAQI